MDYPKTMAAAVERLLSELTPSMRSFLESAERKDLIDLHFSLGMAIRNGYGQSSGENAELLADALRHDGQPRYHADPDEISNNIIELAWESLRRRAADESH